MYFNFSIFFEENKKKCLIFLLESSNLYVTSYTRPLPSNVQTENKFYYWRAAINFYTFPSAF